MANLEDETLEDIQKIRTPEQIREELISLCIEDERDPDKKVCKFTYHLYENVNMAAGVTFEAKTVLGSIIAFSDWLNNRTDYQKYNRYVDYADDCGIHDIEQYAKDLVGTLLSGDNGEILIKIKTSETVGFLPGSTTKPARP